MNIQRKNFLQRIHVESGKDALQVAESIKKQREVKSLEEQDAEARLKGFVAKVEGYASELEREKHQVTYASLFGMYEKETSGKYDIWKRDKDELGMKLAIDIVLREKNQEK